MNNDMPLPNDNCRWAIQVSAIAFLLLVLWQCFGVMSSVPKFPELFRGFGAELPSNTAFVLKYYWVGCIVVAVLSVVSAGFVVFRSGGKGKHVRAAYVISLVALVGAFVWSGFVNAALFAPILSLGSAI